MPYSLDILCHVYWLYRILLSSLILLSACYVLFRHHVLVLNRNRYDSLVLQRYVKQTVFHDTTIQSWFLDSPLFLSIPFLFTVRKEISPLFLFCLALIKTSSFPKKNNEIIVLSIVDIVLSGSVLVVGKYHTLQLDSSLP